MLCYMLSLMLKNWDFFFSSLQCLQTNTHTHTHTHILTHTQTHMNKFFVRDYQGMCFDVCHFHKDHTGYHFCHLVRGDEALSASCGMPCSMCAGRCEEDCRELEANVCVCVSVCE